MTVTMYDSIELSTVPANAEAVAGYVGGTWKTYPELAKRFPHAKHLSIAVNAGEDAEILDVERGDASPAQAPAWFKRQVKIRTHRPGFYCSLSVVNELVKILDGAGIYRHTYRLWVAHYTGRAHICGPNEGIVTSAGATQWTSTALGRNLDQSLCEDVFFRGTPAPSSKWQPNDELNWCRETDRIKPRNDLAAKARKVFLRVQMLNRRKTITREAHKTGWTFRNRLYRYEQLAKRTG